MTLGYKETSGGYEPVREPGEVKNKEALEIIADAVEKEAQKEALELPDRLHLWQMLDPDVIQRKMADLMSRLIRNRRRLLGISGLMMTSGERDRRSLFP